MYNKGLDSSAYTQWHVFVSRRMYTLQLCHHDVMAIRIKSTFFIFFFSFFVFSLTIKKTWQLKASAT